MPSDTLAQRLRAGKFDLSQSAEKLDPAFTVESSFQSQTSPSTLNVIVQIPASGKWQNMNDYYHSVNLAPAKELNDVDYAWLEEVRSKIWKKKELERDLFREVKVTQAHFNELQKRLKVQYPDRNSPEYDGDHDVLRVKLDVLQFVPKKEVDSKMDVDGPEECDGDGVPIFPFTLRFLDLSTLNLTKVPRRMPLLPYLRQEYDDITTLIGKKDYSVVVSGQPGTGEVSVSLSHRI